MARRTCRSMRGSTFEESGKHTDEAGPVGMGLLSRDAGV
jgi:hypothetical protein